MQGRLDSPLTTLGRRQVDLHGRTLARLGGVDELIVSPLGRTRATAEAVNAHVAAPVRYEPALVERDCGDWSGRSLDEIAAAWPESWAARHVDPYHHRPPGGENLADMAERAEPFLAALLAHGSGVTALVTHGVMSRVILKRVLDLRPEHAVTVRHPNELFYRIELSGPRADCCHFLEGQGPRPGLLHLNESETIAGRHAPPGRAEGESRGGGT